MQSLQPTTMEQVLTKRTTVLLVGALTLWRLYLSATLELHPDEAYYWLWSRQPDVAYFDHPPMVAWFIWLSTRHSDAELWVRLPGTLVALVVSGLIWQLALQLTRSVAVAAGSVLLFNVYPLTLMGLMVITPDIPVFLFWSLSLWLFWQLMRTGQTWLWYALGLSFGLALLSKYTAVLLAPCLFLYLLLSDERRWLKTVHPYLALLTGFAVFLPVVYWNSQHDWVSFAFQLNHGLGGAVRSLGPVMEYLAGQMLITGPVVWLLGMAAAVAALWRRDQATLWLLATSLPVIAFFGLSSLRTVAGPNWPAFAYVTFSILVARYCLEGDSRLRRGLWSLAFGLSLALSVVLTLHARFGLLPLHEFSPELAAADASNGFHGWRELGAELRKHPEAAFALAPSHQLSAQIIYYTGGRLPARPEPEARASQFDLWPGQLQGQDGLYVWTDEDSAGPYEEYFAATTPARTLRVLRNGAAVRTYHLVEGQRARLSTAPGDPAQHQLRLGLERAGKRSGPG